MNFSPAIRLTLAVAAVVAGGCANFGNVMTEPEAELQSLKVVQTSVEDIRLVAVMVFHNPNPLTLQLRKIEYRLWVERVTLSMGSLTTLPLIRNHQDQTVEVPLVLKTVAVLAALPPAGKSGDHAYRFAGQAFASNTWASGPIRFESEGRLILPQMPACRFVALHASKDNQKPEFGLEINNPNVFPITVRRLQGQAEFENLPYTWEFRPKELTIAPQKTRRVFIPCQAAGHSGARAAAEKIFAGGALPYWLQGELECASSQGIIMVVIHEKGAAGKKN